jgi:hypothetical protein
LYGDAALCGDVEFPDHSDDGGEAFGEEVAVSHLIPTVLPWRERERGGEQKEERRNEEGGGRVERMVNEKTSTSLINE